jgi:hypothetical protein
VKDRDIDDILKRAAEAQRDVDAAVLNRIAGSINATLRPVRPLPSSSTLVTGLISIAATVAVAGAMILGPHGIQKMNALEIGLIFPVLGVLVWVASVLCVAEAIPGSERPMTPATLAVTGCVGLGIVFGLLFHDYGTERFVSQGRACLIAGLVHAVPTYIATWWLLSRGFAVDPIAAGLAKGILAGLAGVVMLELHCANFEAPHVIVWHIAVIPVSGAFGSLAEWTRARGPRRSAAG